MTDKHCIDKFIDAYRFLSNFYPININYNNEPYPSVEHAYQAAKMTTEVNRKTIQQAKTAAEAKKLGRHRAHWGDWNDRRVGVMYDLLHLKFNDPGLRKKLLATSDMTLIEGNHWGDRFWGVDGGIGQNMLGKLLMRVRDDCNADDAGRPRQQGAPLGP